MHTFIQRSIWGLIWGATIGIAVWLSLDMTRDQPILFAILLVCLAVISVSLVYGRSLWARGAKGSAIAAYGVGALCLCVAVVSEVSYWSGSIEGVHDQIAREKAKAKGKDIVQEKRRQQLAGHVGGLSPAELQAQMDGELTRVYKGATLAVATLNCTDRTSAAFRYCDTYLDFKARLASAQELRDLEGKVLADSTEVVSTTIRRSFYEAARIGSELIGGDVRTWIAGIVGLLVATMMSLHLLSLFIGFAPGRRVEPHGRAEASPLITLAGASIPPATPPLELAETAFSKPEDQDPAPEPVKPVPLTPKEGAETVPALVRTDLARKLLPDVQETTLSIQENLPPRLATLNGREIPPTKGEIRETRSQRKKKISSEAEASPVDAWAKIFLTKTPGKRITGKQGRKHYDQYRKMHGLPEMTPRTFSRLLGEHIDRLESIVRLPGERRPRAGMGSAWWGYDLLDVGAVQKMRVSA